MMLQNRVAVIYGAGGAIGGAVARAFAREGARLFLAGLHAAAVKRVADELNAGARCAEAAEVDALDHEAVDEHLRSAIDKAGRVDISFNAIGIPIPKARVPLIDLDVEQFLLPIETCARSYFLTARAAAKHMIPNRSGVILSVTATPARAGTPLVGGNGAAMAALEALTRGLSAEVAHHGVRVVGVRPQGMPETGRIRQAFALSAKALAITPEQFEESIAGRTHTRRLTTLAELTKVVVFLASDLASGLTGTVVNLSMGSLDD